MPTKDNPALRVHRFLSEALQKSPDIAAKDVWQQVFGLTSSDDVYSIYRSLMHLHQQLDQAEALLHRIEEIDHDLYTRYFPRIRQVLATSALNSGWSDHKRSIPPEVMASLEFCGAKLSERFAEEYVQDEELHQLVAEAEELRTSILEAHIQEELKADLARIVELLRRALLDYRVTGPAGVRDELARALGTLMMRRESIIKNTEASGRLSRIFDFFGKVDAMVARATKYKALVGGIKLLVLGAGADPPAT
jgi:hypothetical protein